MNVEAPKLTAKDFETGQEVRWCPGCGDYAILKAVQKALADQGATPENTVFVSGIGCSSRFPYYMNTFGFHTIHGRAPAIASGVKLTNPDLDVWVVTGDGDGLSIGGNHMLHLLRRNLNMQVLLFNNEIYGLTKGQVSPTSQIGTVSPSSPMGAVDYPVRPCAFALGAGATFVARAVDTQQKQLVPLLAAAKDHAGTAFIEIFQNCIVYNDGVFAAFTERANVADWQVEARHGEPLIYGKDRDKGLRFNPQTFAIEPVALGQGVTEADLLVHDETNPALAGMLVQLAPPVAPMVVGLIHRTHRPTYEAGVYDQIARAQAAKPPSHGSAAEDIQAMLRQGELWEVT